MIGPVYLKFGDKGRLPIYDGDVIFKDNKKEYYIKIKETRYSFQPYIVLYYRVGGGVGDCIWFQTSSDKMFTSEHYPIRKMILERRKKLSKI